MRNIVKTTGHVNDFVMIEVRDRDRVLVGKRSRDIDEKKVSELADDIERQGVLEPILVTYNKPACQYTVVAGAHRWRAICQVWDKHGENAGDFNIAAKIIHVAAGDEEIVELAENLIRNDLTAAQRKDMAMRYKVLVENSGENKIPEGKKIPARKNWFAEWHSACHVPSSTAHEWWQQFADATGLTITPSKANKGQQQAFAQWHLDQIEQKKKDDEMKRQEDQEKAKEAALSNATKEYERAKKIYENACEVAKAAGVVNIFWLQT